MELITFVLLWPLLIFVMGLVYISSYYVGGAWLVFFALLLFVFIKIIAGGVGIARRSDGVPQTVDAQLQSLRNIVLVLSMSILWPIFISYIVESSRLPDTLLKHSPAAIWAVVIGLAIGFAISVWGMFTKNKLIVYSNMFGGVMIIIYCYSQIWQLGQGAKVIGAAVGLAVVVAVSILKFKDKLK